LALSNCKYYEVLEEIRNAYYLRLYGLNRDELRYILDPHDVYGPDYPGETSRVLKEKEIRKFGEYRTRRLVLKAWDYMQEAIDNGTEYIPMVDTTGAPQCGSSDAGWECI